MDPFRFAETMMLMDEQAWKRHAHPFSVWTRAFLSLPLLCLAAWSRIWIGPWFWIALVLAVTFLVLNPRLAPYPRLTDNWGAKATFGQRVWINRRTQPIPVRHVRPVRYLTLLALSGVPLILLGLVELDPWPLLLGCSLTYLGKLWLLDRMVWLYEDMRKHVPDYDAWLRA